MKADDIRAAVAEAKRFLDRTKGALEHVESEHRIWPSPDVAAMKRASLDLTKALAKMRQS